MILDSNQELIIRLSAFIGVILIMLLWEWLVPRRKSGQKHWLRRGHNLMLVMFNTLLIRFVLPLTAVVVAETAVYNGWGLLNVYSVNLIVSVIVSLLVFDLVIYGQHVMFHKITFLWYLHRVHHTDQDFDVTTALRFHPFEIALSMLIKIIVVVLLGAPVVAVMLFELILNVSSMFNHGNVYISPVIDRWLRWLIVTPDMHRVHHSIYREEIDSNYGFNLPWWDRIFGTYLAQPKDGHLKMRIGIAEFSGKITVNVLWLLVQPFMKSGENSKEMGKSV